MLEHISNAVETLRMASMDRLLFWSVASNLLLFVLAILSGQILLAIFKKKPTSPPAPPTTFREYLLATSCVVINTLVMLAGLWLWQRGVITVVMALKPLDVVRDVVILFFVMDFAMYVLHRIAHHRWIFPIVHRTHHHYENPRPLTLFVLNPFETISFGVLWLMLLWAYPATWLGMAIYLAINLAFGLMGHLGVEPMPRPWTRWPLLNLISTTTFHCGHHRDISHNYGFYTLIWDRLFGTTSPHYEEDFSKATDLKAHSHATDSCRSD